MRLINLTIELPEDKILGFEGFMETLCTIKSFQILPDTHKMYDEDKTFKKLVKAVSNAKRTKDLYINDHNGKYANKT